MLRTSCGCSKEDVIKAKDKFKNVRFIFSTWYMPLFSEREIKELFPDLEAVFYAAGTEDVEVDAKIEPEVVAAKILLSAQEDNDYCAVQWFPES